MPETLRGRSRMGIDFGRIIEAMQRHRQVVAAARKLKSSNAYIHQRLKAMGLSLRDILEEDYRAKGNAPFPLGLDEVDEL